MPMSWFCSTSEPRTLAFARAAGSHTTPVGVSTHDARMLMPIPYLWSLVRGEVARTTVASTVAPAPATYRP